MRKGDFIEETLGIAQRDDILKNGMEAHEKYGTFQLDDRDEQGRQYAVGRLKGRTQRLFLVSESFRYLAW